MIRKFKADGLTEIAGNGSFTWWRYRDKGLPAQDVFEPGFFKFFQTRANRQSMIKVDDMFLIHGSDGVQDAIVTEIGLAPDYIPKLMPMGKPFVFAPGSSSKKAA